MTRLTHRTIDPLRAGKWAPENPMTYAHWTRDFVEEVRQKPSSAPWPGPIQDLRNLIERTPGLRMLASGMFDDIPKKEPYMDDPVGNRQVESYEHMLELFAAIMTGFAPRWSMTEYGVGLIGFPFNAILDWPMATESGYAFFLRSDVNKRMKVILDTWRDTILTTSKSLHVITAKEGGWLSKEALRTIEDDTNIVQAQPHRRFDDLFKCDPKGDPEHWGFTCWDDFFVRQFKDIDELRPVAHPDDPRWVANSCESKMFSLQTNVKAYDSFWLKGQPYSVKEMLNHHPFAEEFVDGTVYQAFLSSTTYHRWSSPVSGNVVHTEVVNGTYFSEPPVFGFGGSDGPDMTAPNHAQGYTTHVATRGIMFIDAGGPLGLVGVIYVGMADVSTCDFKERFRSSSNLPQRVIKGEELGMFHHGGSTYCLLFRKGVKLAWSTTVIRNVYHVNYINT